MTTSNAEDRADTPQRRLNLFDSTCIIVGIIVGAGIYESSPVIAAVLPSLTVIVAIWLVGGLLSLVGALCYVELGNAYPREGGDYVYLTRAFGRRVGFLFAWAQLWIVRPGSIGAMAYIFARYAHHLVPIYPEEQRYLGWILYATGAILTLSAVNIVGVQEGKWAQNLLTVGKIVGLVGVAAVGLLGHSEPAPAVAAAVPPNPRLALILVLFAYGGWSEMAYVAGEVKNPRKNLLRAMLLGTVAVTAVYLVVNLAFVHALGLQGFRDSGAAASDVLQRGLGAWGDRAISILICLSALGAVNGQLFTGARIYYAMASEHQLYTLFGRWNPRLGTPLRALVIQAVITAATVVVFGLWAGQNLTKAGFGSGFERMVNFTAPFYWGFLFLVGVGLFVLRRKEPDTPRPYLVPLYPIVPLVFCAFALFMTYSSLTYAYEQRSNEAIWALAALAAGLVAACADRPPSVRYESEG